MRLSFRPKRDKTVPFLILISFLVTFIGSRIITFTFPDLFFQIKNTHIHHFAYGIILLSIFGFVAVVANLSYQNRLRLSVLYGIALGLAFDEFAMWLELDDIYRDRRSIDAVIIITLLILNVIYFANFWKNWGSRLSKLGKILVITAPKAMYRLAKSILS